MNIYLCPSPELYSLYHREGASVIITDIFRASTTMSTAFAEGASAILAVATVEECEELGRREGYLMAAERNVLRCDFADLGNDPLAYRHELVGGRTIVMTTTNGTRSLEIARLAGAQEILVGSFRNMPATLDYLKAMGREEVVVLAAGWKGQLSLEDCLYAGVLALEVEQRAWGKAEGDAALLLRDTAKQVGSSASALEAYLRNSEHYARLERAGLASAVPYCLEQSDAPAIRLCDDGFLRESIA